MNIAQAKQQIRNAIEAYITRDEYGYYCISPEEQRPVFLMGPPGIGKTAIIQQIADEMGVGMVSYSMTHHTRQSALGLPVIVHKAFEGKQYDVSEYTMSEIIAAVYDRVEKSGVCEGILFLDEINCVSETLIPTMLQFLQYKTFGRHKVPDGWIVVAAGNPPEYNRSAREFDVATWDRLKRIDVQPDYAVWKEYALKIGIHAAVLTYLDAKKESFYKVELTVDGKRFVTARGWVDLSRMIQLYELKGIKVDDLLIGQYLQDKEIAEDFAIYYDIFNKYKSDYQLDTILNGSVSDDICKRAGKAPFDERLSLLGLLLDNLGVGIRKVILTEDVMSELLPLLRRFKNREDMQSLTVEETERMTRDGQRGALSPEKRVMYTRVIEFLNRQRGNEFSTVKMEFDAAVEKMVADAAYISNRLTHLFRFIERVWPEGQEMLILVTELTISCYAARFIARYGCDEYYKHNEELMLYQRQTEIIRQLEQLETEI